MSTHQFTKFEKVQARDVVTLIPHGPHSVFAQYVAMKEPTSTALWCRATDEWALGGPLCSRLEVPEVWAYVRTASGMSELTKNIEHFGLECNIALIESIEYSKDFPHSIDLHFLRPIQSAPARDEFVVSRLSMEDFSADRLHPEIRSLLGNPSLLMQDFGGLSNFFGSRVDDMVVAVADTIVSHAGFTAIQQVFTAEAYRKRGIGSSLVRQVAAEVQRNGCSAVYVCTEVNQASAKTAESAGFRLTARLVNVRVGE